MFLNNSECISKEYKFKTPEGKWYILTYLTIKQSTRVQIANSFWNSMLQGNREFTRSTEIAQYKCTISKRCKNFQEWHVILKYLRNGSSNLTELKIIGNCTRNCMSQFWVPNNAPEAVLPPGPTFQWNPLLKNPWITIV